MSTTSADRTALSIGVRSALRCPRCRTALHLADDAASCLGARCEATYPVRAGVPILINDDNSVFAVADFTAEQPAGYFSARSRIDRWAWRLIPPISRNTGSEANLDRFVAELKQRSPRPRLLVVGGGIVGDGAGAVLDDPAIEVVETDVALAERTQLVCDAHDLPFADGSFDGVLVQAVLEHVADPARCVREIHRVLRERGLVYAETPFMQQVHGGRYDFTRFTHLGHRRLFRDFSELGSGAVCGPGMALAWSLNHFLLSFTRRRPARILAHVASGFLFWPLPLVDRFLVRRPAALDAASGVYFLGERATVAVSDRELVELYRGAVA